MGNADQFKAMSKGLDLAQAIFEADRCLLCHDAPCSEACPADTKPAEFIRKLPAGYFAPPRGCARKNAVPCSSLKTGLKAPTAPSRSARSSAF